MSKNPLREELRRQSRVAELTPTSHLSSYSRLVYDEKVEDGEFLNLASYFEKNPTGKKTALFRLSGRIPSELKLSAPELNEETSLFVRDEFKRIVFQCRGKECSERIFAHPVESGLLAISLEQSPQAGPLHSLTIKPKHFHDTADQGENIPTFDLQMHPTEALNLGMLAKGAHFLATSGTYEVPNQKVIGDIFTPGAESPTSVTIGLSGHTAGHFIYPPSMAITINKGPVIFGSQKFKLYRLSERSGVVDMLVRTHLLNTGILMPDVHVVRLKLNGRNHGYYLFEDTYSSSFLENLEVAEGRVVGYDLKKFFKGYPENVRLEIDAQYSPSKFKTPGQDVGKTFTSHDFISRLDAEGFSRLIAFASLVRGTHGLGADDLRFYESRTDGKFYPIVRDLNVLTESISDPHTYTSEAATHFAFWYQPRLPSVLPILQLSSEKQPNPLALRQGLQFWDVHPSLLAFLAQPELRAQFESMLLKLSKDDIENVFLRRMTNARELIKAEAKAGLGEARELTASIDEVLSKKGIFLSERISTMVEGGTPAAILTKDHQLIVHNRLPLQIKEISSGKILSPLLGFLEAPEPSQLFSLRKLSSSSWTKSQYSSRAEALKAAQKLKFQTSDGESLKVEILEDEIIDRNQPAASSAKALVHLLDFRQQEGEATLRYLVHATDPLATHDLKALKLFDGKRQLIKFSRAEVTRPFFTDHTLPTHADALNRLEGNWVAALRNPLELVGRSSEVWTISFPQSEELYFRLNRESVQRVVSEAAGHTMETAVLDAYENFLPRQEKVTETATSRFPAYFEIVRQSDGRKYFRIQKKQVTVENRIVIPKGTTVEINPGVVLKMAAGSGLLVEGELKALGTAKEPIRFESIKGSWEGIAFSHSDGRNRFSHVTISGARGMEEGFLKTNAGLSVVFSDLVFEDSRVEKSYSKDMIHAYHSHFNFLRSKLSGANDDGLDADFSWGKIANSQISETSGNNVDLSHSYFEFSGNTFKGGADKGISAGEKSVALMENNDFIGNHVGTCVKDGSFAVIRGNRFNKNETAIAKQTRKPWYNFSSYWELENVFEQNQNQFSDLKFSR